MVGDAARKKEGQRELSLTLYTPWKRVKSCFEGFYAGVAKGRFKDGVIALCVKRKKSAVSLFKTSIF